MCRRPRAISNSTDMPARSGLYALPRKRDLASKTRSGEHWSARHDSGCFANSHDTGRCARWCLMSAFERYVAIGDSATEGLGDPVGPGGFRGWADRLAERLAKTNPTVQYANVAVRGRRA